jgi:hypothetical protein
MNTHDQVVLSREMALVVREALVIGLASLGVIEELTNSMELAEATGKPWPEAAWPTHPTGTSDAVSKFATALTYVL